MQFFNLLISHLLFLCGYGTYFLHKMYKDMNKRMQKFDPKFNLRANVNAFPKPSPKFFCIRPGNPPVLPEAYQTVAFGCRLRLRFTVTRLVEVGSVVAGTFDADVGSTVPWGRWTAILQVMVGHWRGTMNGGRVSLSSASR